MSKIMIFGYGSLISPTGWEITLKRNIKREDLLYTIVKGYARTWTATTKVYFENEKEIEQNALFLDLSKKDKYNVNGFSLEVNNKEFEYISKREKGYEMVDITNLIEHPLNNSIYYTAIVNNELKCKDFKRAFIPQKYYDFVLNAVKENLNDIESKHFFENTIMEESVQFKNENYKFVDDEINQYTTDY